MAIQMRGKAVHAANLGLYLDRPPLLVPERGLITGANFRISNGAVTNQNVGWGPFDDLNLDSKPVTLIEEFEPSGGSRVLILGNTTDLFQYVGSTLSYITPIYATGTASCAGSTTTVEGSGTTWTTNVKAGDFISFGANDETDPGATWFEIASVTDNDTLELTGNGPNTGGLVNYTIRQTFTGSVFNPFLTETFPDATNVVGTDGDRWYATNGVDGIVGWDGATDQVYLPTIGSIQTCQSLRRFKNTMIFVAPTIGGELKRGQINTSAIGEPENNSTLEAASFTVNDGVDTLIAAYQIGELLAIYSERSIIMAQFVGTPLHFVFRAAIIGRGTRSARGVVRFPSVHYLFGTDAMYQFDGVSARPFASHVWKEVTRASSPNRKELVQAVVDEGTGEMVWVVPLNTDADADAGPPEHAYVGHYLEDVGDYPMPHSTRDLPATATGTFLTQNVLTFDQMTEAFSTYSFRWDDQQLQQAFPQILFGDNSGNIWSLNQQNQNETVPTCFVRHSRRPMVDSRRNGVIKRVYTHADFQDGSTEQLTVKVRLFDSPNTRSTRATAEYNITLDGSQRFTSFRQSGRFIEVEHGSGPSVPGVWSIEGYDLDIADGGHR